MDGDYSIAPAIRLAEINSETQADLERQRSANELRRLSDLLDAAEPLRIACHGKREATGVVRRDVAEIVKTVLAIGKILAADVWSTEALAVPGSPTGKPMLDAESLSRRTIFAAVEGDESKVARLIASVAGLDIADRFFDCLGQRTLKTIIEPQVSGDLFIGFTILLNACVALSVPERGEAVENDEPQPLVIPPYDLPSQGKCAYAGKTCDGIEPQPWRLLEYMRGKNEADVTDAFHYACRDSEKEWSQTAINSMVRKANVALERVVFPRRLSKPKNTSKILLD